VSIENCGAVTNRERNESMRNYNDNLGKMCKHIRNCLSISQKTLAIIIGSNQTEVSFIERGFIPENPRKIEIIEILYYGLTAN
jgi:DNA-binding XRE family transcriptional regulator